MLTDNFSDTPKNEAVIACHPNAVPAENRERWVAAGTQVYAAVQEIQEMPDGYRFRLPTDSAMLLTVADYISNERLSCAFLHFTVEVEPYDGPFWLRLAGAEGVKEYIRAVFQATDLLSEAAASAAGFRQQAVPQTVHEALARFDADG